MTRKLIAYSLGALSLLLTTGAFAQSSNVATVPFSFVAAGVELPAGEYRIKQDPATHFVTIAALKSGKLVYAFASDQEQLPMDATPRLIFNHYGSQHFLAAVWTGGGGTATMFSTTNQEKHAKSHLVASSADGNSPEAVAMK